MTDWTPTQAAAINTSGKTLLLSAGAGSGKTAVLTERIIRSLTSTDSPIDISRLLIVTYTRAAAAELRARISKALSDALDKNPENEHLAHQMMSLGSAKISTIDSFYLDIVHANFEKLSLPPKIRIGESSEMLLTKKNIMDDLIDDCYDGKFEFDIRSISDIFINIRDCKEFSKNLLDVYEKLKKSPRSLSFLNDFSNVLTADKDKPFFASYIGAPIKTRLLDMINYHRSRIEQAFSAGCDSQKFFSAYSPSYNQNKSFFDELSSTVEQNDYEKAKTIAENYEYIGVKKCSELPEESEKFKFANTKARDFARSLVKSYFTYSQELISDLLTKSADIYNNLSIFLNEFDRRLNDEKMSRNIFEFSDISYYAHKLLVKDKKPTELAEQYRRNFDCIYIDEFQDVDAMQSEIFSAISNSTNLFMVGDIKQSIYAFRGADSTIFANIKKSFPDVKSSENSKCASITMSNNFRCDKNIIDFSNLVFSYIFGIFKDSVGYTEKDNLIFSKALPREDYVSPKVNITLIDQTKNKYSVGLDISPELIYIINEISALVKEGKNADGSSINFGDIAILTFKNEQSLQVEKALSEFGIPCINTTDSILFENPEVLLIFSFLCMIDNPRRDIYTTATLRSPFFDFSMQELMEIKSFSEKSCSVYDALLLQSQADDSSDLKKKSTFVISKVEEYRKLSQKMPVYDFVRYLWRDMAVGSLVKKEDDQNITSFYEYARKFENGGFKGLHNFIKYLNDILESGHELTVPSGNQSENAVKIMTVHKSKGLEFKVCFVSHTHYKIYNRSNQEKFAFNSKFGLAFDIPHSSGFAKYGSPIDLPIDIINEQEKTEEAMRLLYVACTRAKERLYITAKDRFEKILSEARFECNIASKESFLKKKYYYPFLLPLSFPNLFDDKCYELSIIDPTELKKPQVFKNQIASAGVMTSLSDEERFDKMKSIISERFLFKYPYSALSRVPAKLSVSRLYPEVLDENTVDLETLENTNSLPDFVDAPTFMDASRRALPTAAEKGTATHVFLQFCDFSLVEKFGVRAELDRLTENKFIPKETASKINIAQIEKFFKSRFYSMLKSAKNIRREQRFNIFLPAKSFTADKELAASLENENLLVQGIIDLLFEDKDGNLILCDYKTDHLNEYEISNPEAAKEKLEQRHKRQLSYYRTAVIRLYGKSPSAVMIYSLPLGEAFEIEVPKI